MLTLYYRGGGGGPERPQIVLHNKWTARNEKAKLLLIYGDLRTNLDLIYTQKNLNKDLVAKNWNVNMSSSVAKSNPKW